MFLYSCLAYHSLRSKRGLDKVSYRHCTYKGCLHQAQDTYVSLSCFDLVTDLRLTSEP